jgi:hypothetical protein
MTSNEIRPEQLLTILKHLASGKGIEVVASIIHLDADVVRQVATAHGYPDREKLSYAVDEAQAQVDKARGAIAPSTLPQQPVSRPRALPTQPTTTPPPRQVPAPEKPDEFRILIHAAKQSEKKRISALADRILEDCAKLRGLLEAETEASKAKKREQAEREAAQAEVKHLEEQLKAARAKLRPAKKTTSQRTSTTTAPKGEYPCRNQPCEAMYDTPQGRSMHERMHCEHRPEAQAAAS